MARHDNFLDVTLPFTPTRSPTVINSSIHPHRIPRAWHTFVFTYDDEVEYSVRKARHLRPRSRWGKAEAMSSRQGGNQNPYNRKLLFATWAYASLKTWDQIKTRAITSWLRQNRSSSNHEARPKQVSHQNVVVRLKQFHFYLEAA